MSDEMSETPPWGRLRWFLSVMLIMLLHLGLLYAVSDWEERENVVPREFNVRLYTGPDAARRLLEAGSLNDPTLLASIGSRGFSGPAWMNVSPPPFKLPEWSDEERWLTQNVAVLGGDFRNYVQTNLGAMVSISKPTRLPPRDDHRVLSKRAEGSRLFVVGQLSSRRMLARPPLPSLPAAGLLNATEVEVLVNDKGFVFSPRLHILPSLRSPAQIAADNKALELIPQLRFAPGIGLFASDEFPFTKGRLIFQWETVAPPSTNQPAAR